MIQYLKALVTFPSDLLSNLHNKVMLNFKNVTYSKPPKINGKLYIYKTGKIILGDDVSINSGPKANPIGGDTRTNLIVSPNAVLEIGESTGLSNCTIVCQEGIKIGNHVKIGGSVKMYDTDFHSLDFKLRSQRETDIPFKKTILIHDHAFIGAHSIILKGVTIGKRSIVGAGSVVTKSIPDDEIWGGNPAKFIKKING